ncbi:MAG: hypothetical protein ACYCZN_12860 [Candidatus Dormibacteria bacterium]
MSQNSGSLLLLAACLLGVGIFATVHRRDAFGALAGLAMVFSAVVVALVGFAASAGPAGAAQLQAFAVLVELMATLFIGVGVALTAVVWRRTGADLLSQLAVPAPLASEPPDGEIAAEVNREAGATDGWNEAGDGDQDGTDLEPDQPVNADEEAAETPSSEI